MNTERMHHICGAAIDVRREDIGVAYNVAFIDPETKLTQQFCKRCDAALYAALVDGELTPQPPAITDYKTTRIITMETSIEKGCALVLIGPQGCGKEALEFLRNAIDFALEGHNFGHKRRPKAGV